MSRSPPGRMQPHLRARSSLSDRRCKSQSVLAIRPARHSAPLRLSIFARPHEVGLIDSWRADSQSLSMARSRNYPMCKNSTRYNRTRNFGLCGDAEGKKIGKIYLQVGITTKADFVFTQPRPSADMSPLAFMLGSAANTCRVPRPMRSS